MSEHLLDVQNLRVSFDTYAGEVQAVRDVSFYAKKGETLAIVGESGCGKSVTSKAVMGLIAQPPGEIGKESQILYHGKNILKQSEKEWKEYRGARCSMIFQDNRLWRISQIIRMFRKPMRKSRQYICLRW